MTVKLPSIAILAGGKATRLYPLTKKVPKSMLELNEKPFIFHQLKLLKIKGIKKVVLCLHHFGKEIKEYVGDGKTFGLKVKYSFDGERFLGTCGAIKKALPFLDDPFFVMYGDSYLDINYQAVFDHFNSSQKSGLMTIIKNSNQWDQSNIVYEKGEIVEYNKKRRNSSMSFIDYGLAVLSKKVFQSFNQDEYLGIEEVYKKLIEARDISVAVIKNRFYEIGSFKGLKETERYIKKTGLHKE